MCTIAILAGGSSSRMGTDKSFLTLDGKPLFECVLDRVSELGVPLIVIANQPDRYAAYGLPIYTDIIPDCGSLGGLYSAINYSPTSRILCVACDMPFLNVPLLRHLIEISRDYDVVVPHIAGMAEGLHAVYNKTCLVAIRTQLDSAQFKVSGFYSQLCVRFVDENECRRFNPDLGSFTNLNRPQDFIAAQTFVDTGTQD